MKKRLLLLVLLAALSLPGLFIYENPRLFQQPYLFADLTRFPESKPETFDMKSQRIVPASAGAIYDGFYPVYFFGKRIGFCKIRIEHGKVSKISWNNPAAQEHSP